MNKYCPNSGKPVTKESTVLYENTLFGFCNPHCRDEFAKNKDEPSVAKAYFDVLLKESLNNGGGEVKF